METVGNGRKRRETVGNGRKKNQAKTCPTRNFFKISISGQRSLFLKVQRCPRGNGRSHFRSAKKHVFYHKIFKHFALRYKITIFAERSAISDCFQPFPLGHPKDLQKKTALPGNTYFKKLRGWTSFGLIMFPTVSDRFHFSERLIN